MTLLKILAVGRQLGWESRSVSQTLAGHLGSGHRWLARVPKGARTETERPLEALEWNGHSVNSIVFLGQNTS